MVKKAENTPSVWLKESEVQTTYNISRYLAREWGTQVGAIAKIGGKSIRYDKRILERDLQKQMQK